MRLFLLCLWAPAAFASVPNAEAWHRLVSILQYLEADFPMAVQSQDAFELSEQKAFMKEAMALGEKLGPEGAGFQATLRALESDVNQGRNAEGVQTTC